MGPINVLLKCHYFIGTIILLVPVTRNDISLGFIILAVLIKVLQKVNVYYLKTSVSVSIAVIKIDLHVPGWDSLCQTIMDIVSPAKCLHILVYIPTFEHSLLSVCCAVVTKIVITSLNSGRLAGSLSKLYLTIPPLFRMLHIPYASTATEFSSLNTRP